MEKAGRIIEKMFDDLYRRSWGKKAESFYKFVNAVKGATIYDPAVFQPSCRYFLKIGSAYHSQLTVFQNRGN